jgi:PAS domain-containing protein
MFVIDADGKVVAANLSACELWGSAGKSIVGVSFASLFVPGADASEVDSTDAQWSTFRTAALERWSTCLTQPPGGLGREVRMRLERAFGGAGSYIATVRPRVPEE